MVVRPDRAVEAESGPFRHGSARTVATVEGDLERLTAYTYLTVPDRVAYIAIMRVFTSTPLADLSAHDLAEHVEGRLAADMVAAKLDPLTGWGNLIPSSRPVKAGSIREYHRVRFRYQLSSLGERIQRQADEILLNADAAREVSREMLALVARGLAELEEAAGGVDPREALDRVSTLFAQFGQFADSVRDLYAYLGQVIFRYDLDGAEFTGFKELLLEYVETITDEAALFAPQIEVGVKACGRACRLSWRVSTGPTNGWPLCRTPACGCTAAVAARWTTGRGRARGSSTTRARAARPTSYVMRHWDRATADAYSDQLVGLHILTIN